MFYSENIQFKLRNLKQKHIGKMFLDAYQMGLNKTEKVDKIDPPILESQVTEDAVISGDIDETTLSQNEMTSQTEQDELNKTSNIQNKLSSMKCMFIFQESFIEYLCSLKDCLISPNVSEDEVTAILLSTTSSLPYVTNNDKKNALLQYDFDDFTYILCLIIISPLWRSSNTELLDKTEYQTLLSLDSSSENYKTNFEMLLSTRLDILAGMDLLDFNRNETRLLSVLDENTSNSSEQLLLQ